LFSQPAVKKLRLPPPSPSLLSLSSGSPPMSPLCPPPSRPPTTTPAAAGVPQQHVTAGMSSQHRIPMQYIAVSGPPPFYKAFMTNSIPLVTPATSPADDWYATASQSSQKSTAQKRPFSLRHLIEDDIIQPGYNVLSVKNPVMFCHQFACNC